MVRAQRHHSQENEMRQCKLPQSGAKQDAEYQNRRFSFAYKPTTYVVDLIRSSCRSPVGGITVQFGFPA